MKYLIVVEKPVPGFRLTPRISRAEPRLGGTEEEIKANMMEALALHRRWAQAGMSAGADAVDEAGLCRGSCLTGS